MSSTRRSRNGSRTRTLLSVSPWYDMEEKNETLDSNAETHALITRAALETFREAWIGGTGVAWNDPRVNMLYADLTGLPPIMVYYGAHEILAGEAVEFAKREGRRRRRQPAVPSRRPAQLHLGRRPRARGGPGDQRDRRLAAIEARARRIDGGLASIRTCTSDYAI